MAAPADESKGGDAMGGPISKATAAQMFMEFDKDKSGQLDKSEVADLAYEMGEVLSPEDVDKLIKEVDTDGNGQVSFDEFFNWFSDPERAKSDTGGWASRALRAQLATRYLQRTTSKLAGSLKAAGKDVEVDPTMTTLEVTLGIGDVPEDPPFSITFDTKKEDIDGIAMSMGGSEDKVCAIVCFKLREEVDEGELYELKGQLDMMLEEVNGALGGPGAPPIESLELAVAEDMNGDPSLNLVLVTAGDPIQQMNEIAGHDVGDMGDAAGSGFFLSKSIDQLMESEDAIGELGIRLSIKSRSKKTGVDLGEKLLKQVVDAGALPPGLQYGPGAMFLEIAKNSFQGLKALNSLTFIQQWHSIHEIAKSVPPPPYGEPPSHFTDKVKGRHLRQAMLYNMGQGIGFAPPPVHLILQGLNNCVDSLSGFSFTNPKSIVDMKIKGLDLKWIPTRAELDAAGAAAAAMTAEYEEARADNPLL